MTRWAAALVAGAVAVGVVALLWWRLDGEQSRVEAALDTMPAQTQIVSFTDWSAARAELAGRTGQPTGSPARLLDAAYERDFSAVSLLAVSDAEVREAYGWSVLDAEWEAYGQSRRGAVEVLRMPDDFDFSAADRRLAALGYADPDEAGVRTGGADLVAGLGLTPQLAHVALLQEEALVVASDSSSYAVRTIETIRGERDPAASHEVVADLASALDPPPVAVSLLIGEQACGLAGFDEADPAVRQQVRARVREAGGVAPLDGLALSLDAGEALTLAMHFASAEEAEGDLQARRALATGAAPGQGGSFEERFTVADAAVDDRVVTLRLEPVHSQARLLSDLGRGSLLPATC
jgi:hypothetical protein